MHNLVTNNLNLSNDDLRIQKDFWLLFPKDIKAPYFQKNNLHGELKAIYSPSFLKNNLNLLY